MGGRLACRNPCKAPVVHVMDHSEDTLTRRDVRRPLGSHRKRYLATVEVLGLDRVLTFQRAMDEDSFRRSLSWAG